MIIQRLLVKSLLTSTLNLWMKVVGQEKHVTKSSISPRVVGGDVITNKDLGGYIVAMYYRDRFLCGGTLIHDLIVITAAHCLGHSKKKDKWVIHGGVSALQEMGVRRKIKKFIMPEVFNMATMEMDVAVVLLDRPMVGRSTNKLSLCKTPLKVGKTMTVSGFGMVAPGRIAPGKYLRKTTVPIVSKRYCRKAYRDIIAITNSMLCASALGKRDACTYDSGGPLVYHNQICGIVSFGKGCASSEYPGVYTDISYVKPFITQSINSLLSRR